MVMKLTYVASHVGDIQSKTVIQAGGDANVIGSGIQGKRVELSAENLNIESLQNKASYDGKQMNVNGSNKQLVMVFLQRVVIVSLK